MELVTHSQTRARERLESSFSSWVAINYPDDLAVMYDVNADPEMVRLDPASIELWRQHTEEFVALGGANLDQ